MPPKKKTKKVKLTPSQLAAAKAEKKAEKKRKVEEAKRKTQIDQLERELEYGRLTLKRHEKSWRALLLKIALPEVRKQLEYAWHNFEVAIDAKNFHISLLLDELKDADEQYLMNQRSHAENINKLFSSFKEQLNELNEENVNTIKEMRWFNEQEVEKIMRTQKEHETYMNMMLYGLEIRQKENEQYYRCEYYGRIEDEEGKNTDFLQKLSFDLHEKYAKLWNDTEDFLLEFHKRTAEHKKAYDKLYANEEQMNVLLKAQIERISQLYEIIRKLKYKRTKLESSIGQRALDLSAERHFFADSFWTLKMHLEKEHEEDNQNLAVLTVETNEAMGILNNIETKLKHIIQLAAICRKYETVQEKVLPFPILGKPHKVPEDMDDPCYLDVEDLETFWKRVGQANAVRYSMCEEKEFLKKENVRLRTLIHEFCECLNCMIFDKQGNKKKTTTPANTNITLEMKKYSKQDFGW